MPAVNWDEERIAAETLRYLGAAGAGAELTAQARRAARELQAWAEPRWAFRLDRVLPAAGGMALPNMNLALPGELASRMLGDCERAVLLVCTLGARFAARLRQLAARSMAEAVVADACGSAMVEAACDRAEEEIAARYAPLYLTDRFSPGYGDLPLHVQAPLTAAVEAEKLLGVTVTDSFLLNPAKTVTAVIGLSQRPQPARVRGCAHCNLRESCRLRRKGESCAV